MPGVLNYDPRQDDMMLSLGQALLQAAGPSATKQNLMAGVPGAILGSQARGQQTQMQQLQMQLLQAQMAQAAKSAERGERQDEARTQLGAMTQPTYHRQTEVDDSGLAMPWAKQESNLSAPDLLGVYNQAYPDEAGKGLGGVLFPKPSEPFTLSPGETRYGANGRPLASAPAAPPTPDGSIKEYNLAKQEGFQGTFVDFLQERNLAKERADLQAKAIAGLPAQLDNADETLRLVDEMLAHPGREGATGRIQGRVPRSVLPADQYDFDIRLEQLKGKAFIEAFQSLKGAGAITEQEGRAATAAMARLDRAQSDEEFVKALQELKALIAKGVNQARTRAGQGLPAIAPQKPATPGGGWSITPVGP